MGFRWFCAWVAVGCLGALAGLVIGVFAFLPIALAVVLLASRPAARQSAIGLVTGIGALLLYVAWVQRAGPGTTCWQHGSASGCDEHLNPLPWLLAGTALFVGGIAVFLRR